MTYVINWTYAYKITNNACKVLINNLKTKKKLIILCLWSHMHGNMVFSILYADSCSLASDISNDILAEVSNVNLKLCLEHIWIICEA